MKCMKKTKTKQKQKQRIQIYQLLKLGITAEQENIICGVTTMFECFKAACRSAFG